MAEKRKKNPTFTSPKGVFKYPRLNEPDTKFKEEGEYSVTLICKPDAPGVQELIQMADEGAAASLAEAKEKAGSSAKAKKWETKYLPYKDAEDEEGEPTGDIEFKFSMKASGVSKKTGKPWSRKPALFDAKGKPLPEGSSVWGGSEGKVAFQVFPYAPTTQVGASVKFALEAAQITKLVSGGEKSADAYGFGEEEGYEAEDETDEDTSEDTADDSDDSADDAEGDF